MKKIFILTGEPSGDKLASKVIKNIKKINHNLEFLAVGGDNLKAVGIKSIYDLSEITYLGFTKVFFNFTILSSAIPAKTCEENKSVLYISLIYHLPKICLMTW